MTPSYGTTNNIGYLASPKLNNMYSKAMLPNISFQVTWLCVL
uniref:Uncharacterized protein n=1 Tax=Anguilla anguilla TaxID=7936 RepID=A0A0E9XZH0_ANGAN